jgi:hypothetical protein
MVAIPGLSREYVYIGIADLNVTVADITLSKLAFLDAGIEPVDADWEDALVVDVGDPLYRASVGPAYVILIGPARGDAVTTLDLPDDDYQVWTDTKVTGSDERIVRIAGTLTVNLGGT